MQLSCRLRGVVDGTRASAAFFPEPRMTARGSDLSPSCSRQTRNIGRSGAKNFGYIRANEPRTNFAIYAAASRFARKGWPIRPRGSREFNLPFDTAEFLFLRWQNWCGTLLDAAKISSRLRCSKFWASNEDLILVQDERWRRG